MRGPSAPFAAPPGDGDRHEQACRCRGDVDARGERVHGLCGRRRGGRVREDRRGCDRQHDCAAELERASDQSGRESLLVVAYAGQRLDVQRRVGEAEAEAGQQTRPDDDGVVRAEADVEEDDARSDERDGAREQDRRRADPRRERAGARPDGGGDETRAHEDEAGLQRPPAEHVLEVEGGDEVERGRRAEEQQRAEVRADRAAPSGGSRGARAAARPCSRRRRTAQRARPEITKAASVRADVQPADGASTIAQTKTRNAPVTVSAPATSSRRLRVARDRVGTDDAQRGRAAGRARPGRRRRRCSASSAASATRRRRARR